VCLKALAASAIGNDWFPATTVRDERAAEAALLGVSRVGRRNYLSAAIRKLSARNRAEALPIAEE
jgi:hypothetical protein